VAVTWVVACGIDLRGTGEDVDASDDNAADAHDADSDAGLVDGPRDSPSIDAPAALSAGSCEAARKGGINSDGERQLYLGGDQAKPFMGYCVGMATGTARTYLTLVLASDGANTSTYDATRLALLREVGPDVADGGVAVSVFGVSVLAVAERTSG